MTLLLGFESRRSAWIGADSASVSGELAEVVREPKVFTRDGWLIAICGDWRVGELIRYAVRMPRAPAAPGEAHRVLCIEFADALRDTFAANGYEPEAEDDGKWGLLVATRNEVYNVQYTFHVERARSGTTALGIGAEYAKGWLDALRAAGNEPTSAMRTAFRKTAACYSALRAPFKIAST